MSVSPPLPSAQPQRPLVSDPQRIRLAMLGMIPGNGHPFSWSAIVNGRYDAAAMEACGYPVIPRYLAAAPQDLMGIPGAEVTHVWCDDPADTPRVAQAACIPHPVERATDVIGQVDAVIIATDAGEEHLERARPFIDAGLPVFIDKPLTDRMDHLRQFSAWQQAGKPLLSSSGMRYAPEFVALRERQAAIGDPRLIHVSMCKTWERYGIHAIESVYGLLAPGGWQWIEHVGDAEQNILVAHHAAGVKVVFSVLADMVGGFGHVDLFGTAGHDRARSQSTFHAFRAQLVAYIDFLRTGQSPIPFTELQEQMLLVIGGLRSRAQAGERISLAPLWQELQA